MEIKDHMLVGENITFDPTPKVSGKFTPDTIIIHYTAGDSTNIAVKTLKNPAIKASAHMVVGMDSEVVQMAPLNVITWHAGRSSYGEREGFNKYSIGIEISNPGYLTKNPDGSFETWYKRKVEPENVMEASHRNKVTTAKYWHKYPQEQIEKVYEICQAICNTYDIQYILGHEEIAPGRKSDPGPAFPLDQMRESILNDGEILPPETSSKLLAESPVHVRPHEKSEAIAAMPKDTELELLREKDGWYKIKFKIKGFVAKQFIDNDNTNDESDAVVNANILNMRDKPDVNDSTVIRKLYRGDEVEVIIQNEGWYEIAIEEDGWIQKSAFAPLS